MPTESDPKVVTTPVGGLPPAKPGLRARLNAVDNTQWTAVGILVLGAVAFVFRAGDTKASQPTTVTQAGVVTSVPVAEAVKQEEGVIAKVAKGAVKGANDALNGPSSVQSPPAQPQGVPAYPPEMDDEPRYQPQMSGGMAQSPAGEAKRELEKLKREARMASSTVPLTPEAPARTAAPVSADPDRDAFMAKAIEQFQAQMPQPAQAAPVAAQDAPSDPPSRWGALPPAGLHRVMEGTEMETALEHDLVIGGPVNVQVSTPVYAHDMTLVIPRGAKVIGEATPVTGQGESRLAVTFHSIQFPDGTDYRIDKFQAMNQAGDVGLKDQVDNHLSSTFGAAAAVGFLSGLGQWVGGGFQRRQNGGVTVMTGNVSDSSTQAAMQVLNRYSNRLPTVRIRAGHRTRVYLRQNLDLPVWRHR